MNQPVIAAALLSLAVTLPAAAQPSFFFSTGDPDGRMASASRPDTGVPFEIESADDFILASPTSLTSGTFTGLIPTGSLLSDIQNVVVEIYRVFPLDSDVSRTSGAPAFSTSQVPTRVNSPSDVAFRSVDVAGGTLSVNPIVLSSAFTALNSVQPGGIHLATGGDKQVTGEEVEFDVTFTDPLDLPPDHYFFVPQVELSSGDFLWLSAPRPITGGTGPFAPDLQTWTRDDPGLAPDWMRIGTDIVDGGPPAPTFNAAFSLTGVVPEPGTLFLLGTAVIGLGLVRRRIL
jgi:hypothetical protein